MANRHIDFWLALLSLGKDANHRVRLWNGYLGWKLPSRIKGEVDPSGGWPQLIVSAPDSGWPELTVEEKETIEELADTHDGHPNFSHNYMDFSGYRFTDDTDFSRKILVLADFSHVRFEETVTFNETRFYGQTFISNASFKSATHFHRTHFDAPLSLDGSQFKHSASFIAVEFTGGASFRNVVFKAPVMFNDSKFEERYYSAGISTPILADFTNATFTSRASFREVLFGNDDSAYSRRLWPERRVDYSNAKFMAATDFRRAAFAGPPAFFNTSLHEDTDFGGIDWRKAETEHVSVDYAIRAWERLELIMSRIEKPLERHQFFRLKMRARRRTDGYFLRALNWLFDKIADYGWGVGRAFAWWFGHWALFGLLLFANTCPAAATAEWWRLARAAFATGFANAHPFLLLVSSEGYLAPSRRLLAEHDELGLLTAIGTFQAVLGAIFLFFLVLTLRNRFRLA